MSWKKSHKFVSSNPLAQWKTLKNKLSIKTNTSCPSLTLNSLANNDTYIVYYTLKYSSLTLNNQPSPLPSATNFTSMAGDITHSIVYHIISYYINLKTVISKCKIKNSSSHSILKNHSGDKLR